MPKHIKDIIFYVKNEIANGNIPKPYVYCPNAISKGTTTAQTRKIIDNPKEQVAVVTLSNRQQNVFCKSGVTSLKMNNRKTSALYGIHQFIDVNENISFINSRGEQEILHKGDKLQLFTTITNDNKKLLIRFVSGISADKFATKYRPYEEISDYLATKRKFNNKVYSTLITEPQNVL